MAFRWVRAKQKTASIQATEEEETHPSLVASVRAWVDNTFAECMAQGPRSWFFHHMFFATVCIGTVAYFVIGLAAYTSLENWTGLEAFYFLIVTMTTTGYGDLVPTSDGAKVFTIFMGILGVVIVTVVVGSFLMRVQAGRSKRDANQRLMAMLSTLHTDDDGGKGSTGNRPRKHSVVARIKALKQRRGPWAHFLLVVLLPFVLLVVLGTAVFSGALHHSVVDGVYWSVITGLGIGYGDRVPSEDTDGNRSRGGMWFACIYIILFYLYVLNALGEVSKLFTSAASQMRVKNTLEQDFCEDMLKAMDSNQNGQVSSTEWLRGVLIVNKICSKEVIDAILLRFEQLDIDGSGQLTADDIVFAASRDSAAVERAATVRHERQSAIPSSWVSKREEEIAKKADDIDDALVEQGEAATGDFLNEDSFVFGSVGRHRERAQTTGVEQTSAVAGVADRPRARSAGETERYQPDAIVPHQTIVENPAIPGLVSHQPSGDAPAPAPAAAAAAVISSDPSDNGATLLGLTDVLVDNDKATHL